MPQPQALIAGRDTEKSGRPPSMSASTSLRRPAGSTCSRPVLIASRSGSAYRDSRNIQFSSLTRCGDVSCLAAVAQFGLPVELLAAGAVHTLVFLAV